ncbi:MAG: glutaredoxin family protein [Betaproteobacteria bacterium]|nr:glutaredoxin family protein [Betaproteobacteria bacterium]
MRTVIFAVLLGAACAASAQLYRWTDDKGRVHVTDTPPPPSAKDVRKRAVDVTPAAASANQPYAVQLAAKNYPVTLYTAPECAPCGFARALLNQRGVPFREVSVSNEQQAEELKKSVGSLSVPAITVGTSVQKGFEQGAYHALLDNAGYPRTGILPPRSQAEPKPAPPAPSGDAPPAEEPAVGPYTPR